MTVVWEEKSLKTGTDPVPKTQCIIFQYTFVMKRAKKVPKLLSPCTAFIAGLSNEGKRYAVIIVHYIMQINFSLLAMPRLRKLGAGFSPRIPWFLVRPQGFFSEHFGFSLSVSFHHCSIPIFTLIILLLEEQRGDKRKPSCKAIIFHVSPAHCFLLAFAEG